MPELPRLKVHRAAGLPLAETINLEQAKNSLFDYEAAMIVAVEGEVVSSYEELVQLAVRECNKNKEFLEIWLYPLEVGGG